MAAKLFIIHFTDPATGDGKTGLTPTFRYLKKSADQSNVTSQPSITEVGFGDYAVSWDLANGEAFGQADGGSALAAPYRYVPVEFSNANPLAATDLTAVGNTVWGTALTEAYYTQGTANTYTPGKMLFSMLRRLFSRSVSGTTETVFAMDNTTPAHTITLDSATNPTSAKQAT